MNRDLAVPLLLGLLLIAALPSTGWVAAGPVLASPGTFLRGALLVASFLALLVVPFLERTGPWRVLAVLLAAGPFLVYGLWATQRPPDAWWVPGPGVWVVGIAAVVVALLRGPAAKAVAVVLLAWVGSDLLLGRAGLPLLPAAWNPVRATLALAGPAPDETFSVPDARPRRLGLKVGALVPTGDVPPRFPDGPARSLARATEGTQPRDRALVALAGEALPPAWRDAALDGALLLAWPFAAGAEAPELDVLDAVLVLGGTFDEAFWAEASEAVAGYVRRGGTLVGPGVGRAWPAPLGRLLGPAGGARGEGLEASRPLGLGRVVRAGSEEAIRASVHEALAAGRVGVVFDDPAAVPPLPEALARWRDDPVPRRSQGLLLLVYALVASALDRILKGRLTRFLGLLAPALAVSLGILWTAPPSPAAVGHALAFDLGGGGGRRVEAVAVVAGPAGYAGRVRWPADGAVALLGGRVGPDGRLRVRPRRHAWIVREAGAGGPGAAFEEAREAGFLVRLVTGPVDAKRIRVGRGGPLGAVLEGVDPTPAWILRVR